MYLHNVLKLAVHNYLPPVRHKNINLFSSPVRYKISIISHSPVRYKNINLFSPAVRYKNINLFSSPVRYKISIISRPPVRYKNINLFLPHHSTICPSMWKSKQQSISHHSATLIYCCKLLLMNKLHRWCQYNLRDNLVVFYSFSESEIWPDERGGAHWGRGFKYEWGLLL